MDALVAGMTATSIPGANGRAVRTGQPGARVAKRYAATLFAMEHDSCGQEIRRSSDDRSLPCLQ